MTNYSNLFAAECDSFPLYRLTAKWNESNSRCFHATMLVHSDCVWMCGRI